MSRIAFLATASKTAPPFIAAAGSSPKKPEFEAIEAIAAGPAWQDLTRYHEQLFEFERLVADERAWMLADPEDSSPEGRKNRQRILALIQGSAREDED